VTRLNDPELVTSAPVRTAGSRVHGPAEESLWASGGACRYAAVTDFTYPNPVYRRGSGIFLHEQTGRPTAACVPLAEPDLLFVLRCMRHDTRILIGTRSWLRSWAPRTRNRGLRSRLAG
jgi:hypothetical protein